MNLQKKVGANILLCLRASSQAGDLAASAGPFHGDPAAKAGGFPAKGREELLARWRVGGVGAGCPAGVGAAWILSPGLTEKPQGQSLLAWDKGYIWAVLSLGCDCLVLAAVAWYLLLNCLCAPSSNLL